MCALAVTATKRHNKGEKQGQTAVSPTQKLRKDQSLSLDGATVLRVEGEGRTGARPVFSLD